MNKMVVPIVVIGTLVIMMVAFLRYSIAETQEECMVHGTKARVQAVRDEIERYICNYNKGKEAGDSSGVDMKVPAIALYARDYNEYPDAWGRPLFISFATNAIITRYSTTNIPSRVYVWSLGKNGINEWGMKDDIRSW